MTRASSVLLAIAAELSELAKNNLPTLREGETIQREWFKNAILYRETVVEGQRFIAQFDFRLRKSSRVLIKGGNSYA